jgi:hypothetical protein
MGRRLSAILKADVIGFSRFMEQDETGTFRVAVLSSNNIRSAASGRLG